MKMYDSPYHYLHCNTKLNLIVLHNFVNTKYLFFALVSFALIVSDGTSH